MSTPNNGSISATISTVRPAWYFSKAVFTNLNRNWLGYLTLTTTLYLLTPFPLQINDWPTVRQRLLNILELPVKAIDSTVAAMEGR